MGKHRILDPRRAFLVFLLVLPAPPVIGQPEFSITGYVLNFPSYLRIRSSLAERFAIQRDQILDITRIRLRPAAELWEEGSLSLEYEIAGTYHSSTSLFSQAAGQSRRQVVNLTWNVTNGENFSMVHFIDRLHFRQGFAWGDVVVGRQRISWGTGRIWNPTDLFNPISPTSYAKVEKDGVDAAMVKLRLGEFTDLSLVCNPQKDWTTSNNGFRFRSNFNEFDIAVMGGSFDRRTVIGGDFAGNLFDAGVRGEAILSADPERLQSNFLKIVLGVDYQFTSTFYGLLEYYFNGEGSAGTSSDDFQRVFRGEIQNVGRNYLAVQGAFLVHPLVNVSGSWIGNLDDRSQFLGTTVAYSAGDEVAVAAGAQVFLGTPGTEYWYYPLTIYAKVDFYF